MDPVSCWAVVWRKADPAGGWAYRSAGPLGEVVALFAGREAAEERAYAIMVTGLPASFIEGWYRPGEMRMRPKAVRLRDKIADALQETYEDGRHYEQDLEEKGRRSSG